MSAVLKQLIVIFNVSLSLSLFYPACINSEEKWCKSGRAGGTQSLDWEMDKKEECSIKVVLAGALLCWEVTMVTRELRWWENKHAPKHELLQPLSEHLIAFRAEMANFFIMFSFSRRHVKALAGSQSQYTQKAGNKVQRSGR